ncbi:hypothetical protein LEP1GSC133_0848 [Leptospira borgpetersenii serovar Pomona str. 200901868]|uniref:Uncharacterized protein n=1 Tax=Leptospira borgpetersenii serovar Pomona str. 200901868 TaxID=1192866 RepID=M6WQU4_LEPBO|nr:hypothetical protein LEP1GSC133_0848 [Leptospira borgpetersenii serovar Pomona str. 200901868]
MVFLRQSLKFAEREKLSKFSLEKESALHRKSLKIDQV